MNDQRKLILPRGIALLTFLILLSLSIPLGAQDIDTVLTDTLDFPQPAPPSDVKALDHEYDRGEQVNISWSLSPDDTVDGLIGGYEVIRVSDENGEETVLGVVSPTIADFKDDKVEPGKKYFYKVASFYGDTYSESAISNAVTPDVEIINWRLWNLFLIALVLCGAVIYFIAHARKGKKLFIRKIAGLDAIDEAIGRATEMGRPILFVPGINDMDDVQTIAGITLLSKVAKVVADYDIRINMPVSRSLVMTTARETIKEAYIGAGRPDAYNDDMVRYITDEQFGYVAAVDGIMVREKPATCFYLGAFFAESLILAETGNSIGAIQIAGTAMPAQLPFFVAACDYTLIGEELFAASAYLSNEPKQLGSLKGQDIGKVVAMAAILIGVLAATLAQMSDSESIGHVHDFMIRLFTVVN